MPDHQQHQKPSYVAQALFNAAEIKQIEQQAASENGYTLYHLMEKAGLACWHYVQIHWPDAQQITILCGKGNNAGDGFVLARLAAHAGKNIKVLLVEDNPEFKGDALTAYQVMLKQGIEPQIFDHSLFSIEELTNNDLIVDGILGTGLSGPLRDNFKEIIKTINELVELPGAPPVFSIDIPSGLESDTGFANPIAIAATRTLTFIGIKSGMMTGHARICCGKIDLDYLEIESKFQHQAASSIWIDDADKLIDSLPNRSAISHKGDHGHLLLVGGDYGFGGAILMSAIAAARCGAGMLTILTRDAHVAPILSQCPEAMIRSVTGADDPSLAKLLENIDAVVIGPGLGQESWGKGLLDVICKQDIPMLIDADALNLLATETRQNDNWVITPHPGEASRLLGIEIVDVQKDRYAAVTLLQSQYSGVAVLKGAGTLMANKELLTTVCNEGNPGMASAGMGDILSGIIGSLLAQGIESSLAARIGVALHARAGDLAAMNGQKGLMATDLIDPLRVLVNQ